MYHVLRMAMLQVCHDAEEARDLGDFRSTAKLGEKLEDIVLSLF